MTYTIENPPAFPLPVMNHFLTSSGNKTAMAYANSVGMTLRDYFAAAAMQTMIPVYCNSNETGIGEEHLYRNLPFHAYNMANAMLRARGQS